MESLQVLTDKFKKFDNYLDELDFKKRDLIRKDELKEKEYRSLIATLMKDQKSM